MSFLPSRTAIGSSLLRFLGRPEQPQLAFSPTVLPVKSMGPEYPGLYASPQREVWIAGGQVDAVVGEFGGLKIWAAPNTFESSDPRVGAGIYVFDWHFSIVNGGAWINLIQVGVNLQPEVDPGADSGAGNVVINSVGGRQFLSAGAPTSNPGSNRSPRAQVNMDSNAVQNVTLARWPVRSATSAPLFQPLPFFVPPGHSWQIQSTTVNEDVTIGVSWVEAEELPIPAPLPNPAV